MAQPWARRSRTAEDLLAAVSLSVTFNSQENDTEKSPTDLDEMVDTTRSCSGGVCSTALVEATDNNMVLFSCGKLVGGFQLS